MLQDRFNGTPGCKPVIANICANFFSSFTSTKKRIKYNFINYHKPFRTTLLILINFILILFCYY